MEIGLLKLICQPSLPTRFNFYFHPVKYSLVRPKYSNSDQTTLPSRSIFLIFTDSESNHSYQNYFNKNDKR